MTNRRAHRFRASMLASGAVAAAAALAAACITPTSHGPAAVSAPMEAAGSSPPALAGTESTPPRISGRVQKLAAAHGHTCALLLTGEVACWGAGIGAPSAEHVGVPTNALRPQIVPGVAHAIDVAVGASHACALKPDGDVACWGASSYGQLGQLGRDGAESAGSAGEGERARAVVVPDVHQVVEIASRVDHTCARRRDGHVLC